MKTKIFEAEAEVKPEGLKKLFIDQLSDLYSAENQLIKALPKMVNAACSPDLKSALDEHLRVTQEQVNRLEKIFDDMHQKPKREKCEGMHGIVAEGEKVIRKKEDDEIIKDADLIAAAQRVEHYEIAGYGTARTFAELLGMNEAAELLQQTLDEEGEADKTLTAISEKLLSQEAVESAEEEFEDMDQENKEA